MASPPANFLQRNLFSKKLVNDTREPFYTFIVDDRKYGIVAPDWRFWFYAGQLLVVQTAMVMGICVVLWRFMIQKQKQQQNRTSGFATASFVLGYGIILPGVWLFPLWLVEWCGIENVILKTGLCTLPANATFACLAAMHGTAITNTNGSEPTLLNYMLQHMCVIPHRSDNPGRDLTLPDFLTNLRKIFTNMILASLLLSYALQYPNCQPFSTQIQDVTTLQLSWQFVTPGHLANNYVAALLTYLTLNMSMSLASLLNHAQGRSAIQPFRNPLLGSSSPTDFWTKRWNVYVHTKLKRGVYLPLVRSRFSKRFAIVATFVASGILHDLSWQIMFRSGQEDKSFNPLWFKQLFFFFYCGCIMVLERPLGLFFQEHLKSAPLFLRSTLVVLTVLPLSHWFTGDWIAGNYFRHFSIGIFRIVPMPS